MKEKKEDEKLDNQQKTEETQTNAKKGGPKEVIYCQGKIFDLLNLLVCTLPPEYCFLTKTANECKVWLKSKHSEMHEIIYPEKQQEQ